MTLGWRSAVLCSTAFFACADTQKPAKQPSGGGVGTSVAEDRPAQRSTAAEIAFVGGKVRTLDPKRPEATAVAIKDGKILAVGDDAEIQRVVGPGTKLIGLEGRTIVPGLIDAHLHLHALGARHNTIDLKGAKSIEEIRAKVKAAAEKAGAGGWLVGEGWDQNRWGGKFPTARDLDVAAPKNPVLLERVDGHAVWVNSRALETAGIDAKVKAPAGGRILMEGGRPSGVLVDNAMSLVSAYVPPPAPAELKRAYRVAQEECLAAGLVEVHDMGIGLAELEALQALDEAGELRIRVYAMLDGSAYDLDGLTKDGPRLPSGARRLTVRGLKFFLDGALGSRGAALFEPYSDEPGHTGLILTEPDLFEARVRTAKDRGFQVATHAIGDRANHLALDVYGRVFGGTVRATRPRVEHAQVVSIEDLPRFGRMGVVASMQPTHATSDMPWAEKRIGPSRMKGAYAWRSMLTSSATIAAGSDAPVEEVSPLLGLYAAITRRSPAGEPKGGWRVEEAMKPVEALHAFTRGGVWASFREKDAGLIRPGFVADLTVLDADPIADPPEKLLQAKASLTVIAGVIEHAVAGADQPPQPKPEPKPEPKAEAPDAGPSPDASDATADAGAVEAGASPDAGSLDAGSPAKDAAPK